MVKKAATPRAVAAKVAVPVIAQATRRSTRARRGQKAPGSPATQSTASRKAAAATAAQPKAKKAKTAAPTPAAAKAKPAPGSVASETVPPGETRPKAKKAKTAAPTAAAAKAKPAQGSVTSETVPPGETQPKANKATAAAPAVAKAETKPAAGSAPTQMEFVENAVRVATMIDAPRYPEATLMSLEQLKRASKLLPQSDLTAIGNLPEDFMGFEAAIAPIIEGLDSGRDEAVAGPSRAPTIDERFATFCGAAQAVHLGTPLGKMRQGAGPPFRLTDDAGVRFFTGEGARYGTRTHNHQCDTPGCSDQACCPKEYNFSSIVTYAAKLAKGSSLHGHVFTNETFKKFVKAGTSRQQTNGRFSLPAPPILLPDAEQIAAEGYAAVEQHRADYSQATTMAGRAKAARRACSDAQHLAIFAIDLSTGKRTADITAALTADVYKTGATPSRRISVYHKTSKILLPVHPWCVQERPGSLLCPVETIERYLQVCTEFDVHIGSLSNGEGGSVMCSPFMFPFIAKDPITGFPCVTRTRQMRNDSVGTKWEHATTTQCNSWLKRMLVRLDGTVSTDYTIHGARVVAALVALASGQQVEAINKTHGWRERSQMVRSYARLVQLQSMTQEPVLRDTPASALLANYELFFM